MNHFGGFLLHTDFDSVIACTTELHYLTDVSVMFATAIEEYASRPSYSSLPDGLDLNVVPHFKLRRSCFNNCFDVSMPTTETLKKIALEVVRCLLNICFSILFRVCSDVTFSNLVNSIMNFSQMPLRNL